VYGKLLSEKMGGRQNVYILSNMLFLNLMDPMEGGKGQQSGKVGQPWIREE
jgi:hypothetical protein